MKVLLKNVNQSKNKAQKERRILKKKLLGLEKEDSNYGRETEEDVPNQRRRRLHVPNESFTIH
jgi:hypothetical protein